MIAASAILSSWPSSDHDVVSLFSSVRHDAVSRASSPFCSARLPAITRPRLVRAQSWSSALLLSLSGLVSSSARMLDAQRATAW